MIRLTEDQLRSLRDLLKSDIKVAQVVHIVTGSEMTAAAVRAACGRKGAGRPRRELSFAAAVVALREAGSIRGAASKLGCPEATLRSFIKAHPELRVKSS
jgi:hypothetical protein